MNTENVIVLPHAFHLSSTLTHPLLSSLYLLAEGVHEHPHGRSGPDHEGGVAARVSGEVHLELFSRLQQAGEEDVAEFVDVEQRGAFDAELPYGRLDRGATVLQKQLAGLRGLA